MKKTKAFADNSKVNKFSYVCAWNSVHNVGLSSQPDDNPAVITITGTFPSAESTPSLSHFPMPQQ